MAYRYLFGPVPSRRLGRSLGIDLVPPKTCPFDCVYCECGQTTNLTCERREYVPTDRVIVEIDDCLAKAPDLDYVTFAGSRSPVPGNRRFTPGSVTSYRSSKTATPATASRS